MAKSKDIKPPNATPTPTPKAPGKPKPVTYKPQFRGVYTTVADVTGLWNQAKPVYQFPAAHAPAAAPGPTGTATPAPVKATPTPAPVSFQQQGYPGYQFAAQQPQQPQQQQPSAPVYSGYGSWNGVPQQYQVAPTAAPNSYLAHAQNMRGWGPTPPEGYYNRQPASYVIDADNGLFSDWEAAWAAVDNNPGGLFGDAGHVVQVKGPDGSRAYQAVRGETAYDEFGKPYTRYSTIAGKALNSYGYEGGYNPYQKGPTGSGGTQDLGYWKQSGDYGGAVNSYARGGSSSRG